MKALLDTNIILHRESSRVLNENIGQLFYWLDKLRYTKCIHSLTVKEIEKYKDELVKKSLLAKIQSYELLELSSPLHHDVEIASKEIDVNDNDIIDTRILNELYCGRVDILITEDKKLYKKAVILGVGDKVRSIDGFLEWVVVENPKLQDYKVKNIRIEKFGNVDLNQPFFDSLKHDYPEFEKWYLKNYDKEAYISGENNKVTAFLSLKVEPAGSEDYSNITPVFMPKKRLKIRTFKVTANGYKIGERFIKIIFDNAVKNKVEEIYVTLFPEDEAREVLVALLTSFGFTRWGTKDGKEDVYVRSLKKDFNIKNILSTYPFYMKQSDAYIVTINEQYHTSLFPDSIVRFENPGDFSENKSFSNAIRKYFLTRAYTSRPKPGDILVFCRTAGSRFRSVITTIGVVCGYLTDFDSFYDFYTKCSRRCALSKNEMKQMWDKSEYYKPKVLDFIYIETFPKKINVDRLIQLGFNSDDMKKGIIKISGQLLDKIIEETDANKNLLV